MKRYVFQLFQEHSHPTGLYLKVKILLQGDTEAERLQSGEFISHFLIQNLKN
jgi:hypothetical protein